MWSSRSLKAPHSWEPQLPSTPNCKFKFLAWHFSQAPPPHLSGVFFPLDLWHSPWWLCAGSCPSAFSSTKWSQDEWGGRVTTWRPCTSTSPSWARPRPCWWSAAPRWSSWAGTSTSMSSKCWLLPGRYGQLQAALVCALAIAIWR